MCLCNIFMAFGDDPEFKAKVMINANLIADVRIVQCFEMDFPDGKVNATDFNKLN